MDSLYTTKTDDGWEARIASFKGVGKGDTELDAVKSLARALRNKLEEAYERAAQAVTDARGQNRDGLPDYNTLVDDIRALNSVE